MTVTANIFKLKRSNSTGNVPAASALQDGELALNTYDSKLFFKTTQNGGSSYSVATLQPFPTGGEYGQVLVTDGAGNLSWTTVSGAGGGGGSVTNVSVATNNGFSGTVTNSHTNAVINLNTTITGLLKGDGVGIRAAVAGTDYITPSTTFTTNPLTIGTGLSGVSFNGSSNTTIAIDTSVVATKTYVTGLGYLTSSAISVRTNSPGSQALSFSNGVFTFTPADLSGYTTTSSLNTALSNYVTTSTLANYITSTNLSDALSTYALTSTLANYVTNSSLSTTLNSYLLKNASIYLGTSSVALDRSSGAQTLNGVSIDGNAGTVTNGVYTTGSYTNPSWISSLDGSKLSGTVVATNGVVTTGNYSNPSFITSLDYSKITNIPSAVVDSINKAVFLYQDGNLKLKTGTIRWYAPASLTISSIVARVATTSDSYIRINVKKNGTVTNTIDIASPDIKNTDTNGFTMGIDDYLTVDVVHTGSSSQPGIGLRVQFNYTLA
jgi:hypothetical protein